MDLDYEKCIDCGICTRNCLFLKKYRINLKDYASRLDLAYNCYLCGKCREVCPVDIDGKDISLDLRRRQIESGCKLQSEGYRTLILEKKNYIFKNYKKGNCKKVLFPGCNFPAYYPETTKKLLRILEDEFNITTVFDCCGKPISDLAMKEEETIIKNRIINRFKSLGIEEIILLCPNCYSYFKNNTDIKISMIYEHEDIMDRLISKDNEVENAFVFLPCPDREKREIYHMLEGYIELDSLDEIDSIQCCGAGGCASVKEKELTVELQDRFKDCSEKIYVYCATCSAMIGKSNDNVEHILCRLMNSNEEISRGFNSIKNRALFALNK